MSFDDWLEVWLAKSPRSHRATCRPRVAASRAMAAPVAPPPTTSRSNVSSSSRRRAVSRQPPPVMALRLDVGERDVQLFQLLAGDRGRRLGAEVCPFLRLGEGDHVA